MRILRWALAMALASKASAQIPAQFENLQVFPKDIARRDLVETMRSFSFSVGLRCEGCHVGDPSLDRMDFASDDMERKRIARRMLRMVAAINEEHLSEIGREEPLKVQCFTCHRGIPRPEPLESIVANTLETAGLDAAIARYRDLRKDYYGSSSYDFGETPLNRLGEELMRAGKNQEAVALLELNAELQPASGWLFQLLGEAHLASGDRDKARDSFEKSLAALPGNAAVRKRLEELKR